MLDTDDSIYLAGPMSWIPHNNFPAFDKAAETLRSQGFKVISPSELDDPESRKLAMESPDGAPDAMGETWGTFLSRDIKIVADAVNALVLLPGWERSRGARLETLTAKLCGHKIYRYNGRRVGLPRLAIAWVFGR